MNRFSRIFISLSTSFYLFRVFILYCLCRISLAFRSSFRSTHLITLSSLLLLLFLHNSFLQESTPYSVRLILDLRCFRKQIDRQCQKDHTMEAKVEVKFWGKGDGNGEDERTDQRRLYDLEHLAGRSEGEARVHGHWLTWSFQITMSIS